MKDTGAIPATANRLASGGLVDRASPLAFSFDGRSYTGLRGDTLASALMANGVRLVGRSFKYHRPRGTLSAGSEEPNALVELRGAARREPNTRATTVELYDGLVALSQNRWPSLDLDVMSVTGLAAPLLGAGFYYKTFMWPAAFWEKVYEPLIRRSAGLGRLAHAEDPDHYEKSFAHCDVLVIGAGPAGLMAALAAGRSGARVILADEDFVAGGRLLSERAEVGGATGAAWAATARAELASLPNVRLMPRTTVFGVYDQGTYGALERVNDHVPVPPQHEPRQRLWRIVAKRSILAAGAIERPLVFGDNDRPGIMLAGAVRSYVNRFAALPGRTLVVYTATDDGWRTAHDAIAAGAHVEAVVDTRADHTGIGVEALARSGTRIVLGGSIVGVRGAKGIEAVTIADVRGRSSTVACTALGISGGWQPTLNLTCHLGGKPVWRDDLAAFVPGQSVPPGMTVVGAAAGTLTLHACLSEGAAAGAAAARDAGRTAGALDVPTAADEASSTSPMWLVAGSKGKAFVDFQNDVTTSDIDLAQREGFRSVELTKRYTTAGMATDQGKTANVNTIGLVAARQQSTLAKVGTTVYRPPYTPVSFGALGGHHRGKAFRPTRLPPAHGWAVEQGAVMREAGQWLRAGWFPVGQEDWLAATTREVKATRAAVGICDVSTLGKIDIQGADAATFLDRVYCNTFSTLPVGKARYGLMLREDGFVKDDGTTSRLGPEHFVMTTTTANAGAVMEHLEFCHQCLWPELDVQMVSVSEQWAQFSVAGPRARDVLAKIVDRQHDISNAAFPYLAAREITVGGGLPARLFRISFSGELAYEIAVPARRGDALARALMAAGREFGIVAYGLEALSVMRIEKGHVAGGELNGTTTARDLGLGKMMSKKKDYIGRVLAERPALSVPERWDLVGLRPVDPTHRIRAGAHCVDLGKPATTANDLGYVTSVAYSPMLERWIALGLVSRGRSRMGERVRAADPLRSSDVEVEIVDPVFYDREGARLHG